MKRKPGRKAEKRARRAQQAAGGGESDWGELSGRNANRAEIFESASRHTTYLGVSTDSGRFLVSSNDSGVGRSLFVKGGRPEFRVMLRIVRVLREAIGEEAIAGRVFVEVGANIGTTTVCALVEHGFGSAVCCEPVPESNRILRANLALNGVEERARTLQVAASDSAGTTSFVIREDRPGASWILGDRDEVEKAIAAHLGQDRDALEEQQEAGLLPEMTVIDVELTTLDQLVEDGVIDADRAGLVWIDAEGHEGHVLSGARRLAGRGVPVLFEFHPAGLEDADRERIHALAEEFYTHFVDVRRHRDRSHDRLDLRPIAELRDHTQLYLDAPADAAPFTDMLLLRVGDRAGGRER